MKDTESGPRPISAKRQKILANAFEQLRKSRAKVDPGILRRIRDIVSGSPAMMRKLGLMGDVKPDADMPLSQKSQKTKPVMTESMPPERPETKLEEPSKGGYEKIDQAKNMEIMAKLMALNPSQQENIKAIIKKSGK